MNTFCTIITTDYLPYALALFESIAVYDKKITLNILISDSENADEQILAPANVILHNPENVVSKVESGIAIWNKYKLDKTDKLRWCLKPVFINYLLAQAYDKVIFTDPDTYYFSDYSFLFDHLDRHDVILTPHWRGLYPSDGEANFELQFVGGLYNAGFIGVSRNGTTAMNWWAGACLYSCVKDFSIGHYVDQTYLNLMPVYFDKVEVLKHQGCNVANWNQVVCKRTTKEGRVLINDKWPVVFIHFTHSTIRGIINGSDHHLKPFLDEYQQVLAKYRRKFGQERLETFKSSSDNQSSFSRIKNWFSKRTRNLR